MLPLFWIGATVASAFIGKKIYDSITEDKGGCNFDQNEQASNKEILYNKLLDEQKKYFKSKNIKLKTSSYANACRNSTKPFIVFAKSQELDEFDGQIHLLKNDIEQLEEIQNMLKVKFEEIS